MLIIVHCSSQTLNEVIYGDKGEVEEIPLCLDTHLARRSRGGGACECGPSISVVPCHYQRVVIIVPLLAHLILTS